MSQKYLNKNPKIKVGGASKRRNQPTKQNMNKAGISNRQIHKKSSKLTKIIETPDRITSWWSVWNGGRDVEFSKD